MTTRDFIAKNYNVAGTQRQCSSVMASTNGTIYSYGSHYPLAFNIKGLDFVNEQGYSSTTSKHIAWARQALNYQYVGVKLWRDDVDEFNRWNATTEDKLRIMHRALERELTKLKEQMDSKKRRDTQVYRYLDNEYERVLNSRALVSGALVRETRA